MSHTSASTMRQIDLDRISVLLWYGKESYGIVLRSYPVQRCYIVYHTARIPDIDLASLKYTA